MLQLSLRYIRVTASIKNTIRQIIEIDCGNGLGSLRYLSWKLEIQLNDSILKQFIICKFAFFQKQYTGPHWDVWFRSLILRDQQEFLFN